PHGILSYYFIKGLERSNGIINVNEIIEYIEHEMLYEKVKTIHYPRKKKFCYIIMPFSKTTNRSDEYWTFFNKYLIKPAVQKKAYNWSSNDWIEYDCERGIPKPANIMKELLKDLVNAELVIGVLTDRNANVWYELGIRHTLHKPTVMILEKNQDIPFDINQYGIVWYDSNIIRKSISIPIVSYFSYFNSLKWKWNYHKTDEYNKNEKKNHKTDEYNIKDKIYSHWHYGAFREDTVEGEVKERIYFDLHGNEYRESDGKSKLKVYL